jgi:hypothetical protein
MLTKKVPLHDLRDEELWLAPTYGQRCLDKPLPRFDLDETDVGRAQVTG